MGRLVRKELPCERPTYSTPPCFTVHEGDFGESGCLEAYSYRRSASSDIRGHVPKDVCLHAIADGLQTVQRRNFDQLHADVSHRGHDYHAYCVAISVERDRPTWQGMTSDAGEIATEGLRDLADWFFRQLEREYKYLTSDESLDDTIIATEAGRHFG